MKQRMKYIIAFHNDSEIILLDEPFTNLDNDGIEAVKL
jgi:ABC-type multidrug transport system ATPase subunit